MKAIPFKKIGYDLLHQGILTFSEIERNGIRIDVDYLEEKEEELEELVTDLIEDLKTTKLGAVWYATYRGGWNWDSSDQLKYVLFEKLGIESIKQTKKGGKAVDAEVLLELKDTLEGVEELLDLRKWSKALNTYIRPILRNTIKGYLYCSFNLHTVRTYRSSSSDPNFQNIPIRDPEIGKLIRRAFLPRKGRRIVEVDFSGLEVRIAACYHKDKRMMEYIRDQSKDMHRDMACECFILPIKEVTKLIRYVAKNRFVFPAFYGSYFAQIAPDMWKAIVELNLVTESGIPLKEHLVSKGIKTYQQFEDHIKKVEDRFWGSRFKEYAQWKEDWYSRYLNCGYFDLKTGFRISGEIKRNDVINYPVQGSAFHCLLWSVIQLHKYLEDKSSMIIGQIHDSIVLDVDPDELQDLLDHMDYLMCRKLQNEWTWINVPLETEVEVTEIDESWDTKKEWKKIDGKWSKAA
jgi:DNA polymerase-1